MSGSDFYHLAGGGLASKVYVVNSDAGNSPVVTPTITEYTGPFTIATGAASVYIRNDGAANITVLGYSLKPGDSFSENVSPPTTIGAITGDATGSKALVAVSR